MYITVIAIFIAIIYFFGIGMISTIYNNYLIPSVKSLNIHYESSGFMWFISILLVNILILIFIIGYYHYKMKYSVGPAGPRGFTGENGMSGGNCEMCDKAKND